MYLAKRYGKKLLKTIITKIVRKWSNITVKNLKKIEKIILEKM